MMILDEYWINTPTSGMQMGIIKAQDQITGEVKFYIGTGTGMNEKIDRQMIIDWGSKVDPKTMIDFFTLKHSDPKPEELPGQKKIKFEKNEKK